MLIVEAAEHTQDQESRRGEEQEVTEPGEVDADGGAEVALDLVERLRLEHVHWVRPLLPQQMQLELLVHAVHGDELLVDERLHHQVRAVQRAHQLLAVRELAAESTSWNEQSICSTRITANNGAELDVHSGISIRERSAIDRSMHAKQTHASRGDAKGQ